MNKTKYIIEISAVFGSEFQKEVGEQALGLMLEAWQAHVISAHKKNSIAYYFKNEEARIKKLPVKEA